MKIKPIWIGLIVLLVLIAVGAIYFFITRYSAPKEENSASTTPAKEDSNKETEKTKPEFKKLVFFIHHSTGEIYWNNGMSQALEKAGYKAAAPWWDGNTDPQDFYTEFSDTNKWQILKPYDIIIFKSCFPASNIDSDEMLENYKTWYNELNKIYQKYPDKLFVPLSTPPLLQNHTTPEAAARALKFEKWLLGEYKNKYSGKNLAPFGLHSLLSDSAGYLKSDYIESQDDDHPNENSGKVVGAAIVKHLNNFLNE